MVTEFQLETSNSSVFEVDTIETAWDQEELSKVKLSSHPSNLVWKGLCFLHLSTLCDVCGGVL